MILKKLFPVSLLFVLSVVSLNAQSPKRAIAASPVSVDFGGVAVGSTATRTIQLTNTGRFSVRVSGITSSDASFVTIIPALPLDVASGTSVTFSVRFIPSAAGGKTASVSVLSNATNSPATVSMTGTGVAAVAPLAISTAALPGAMVGTLYSTTLTGTGGTPSYNWSVAAGALPAGLALSTNGAITGMPAQSGASSFTARLTDALGNAVTKPLSISVATNTVATSYGNTGDPYEGTAPGAAVSLSACQALMPNTSYRLARNVNALTPTDVCFQITGAGTTLDLNGYKVTGRIVGYAVNINGTHIFNGSVECVRDAALGGNVGCVFLYGDGYAPTATVKVHHLTLANNAACGRSFHLEWAPTAAFTAGPYAVRLYNVTSATAPGPTCTRAYNFSFIASNTVTVEVNNNDAVCGADTAACQGVMFYGNDHGRVHHNRFTMMQNFTAETARAVLCDGHADYCEVDNNLIIANNNRAVRVRESMHARIHDNTVERVTCCGVAGIHLGDPDAGSTDLDAIVENNSFEVVDGTVLMIRGGYNAWFRRNILTCAGCSGTIGLARVRTMGTTNIVFENNPSATVLAGPQINVESTASASVCNSGQASGAGTITYPACSN